METITPIPLIRCKIPDAHPEAAPENPPEGFAQVLARQKKFSRPKENPVGLEREGAGPKTPLTPKAEAKEESPDPANDPEVTSFLPTPISNAVLPSPPNQPGGPPVELEDPTFPLKLEAQAANPALASTEQIGSGSRIQSGPEDFLITSETAALELKSDSQASPLAALSRTEKVPNAPISEEPLIAGAGPVESNSQALKIAASAASPATSKEILADRGTSSLARVEGLPDPEKTSPTSSGLDPETSFLPRASSKKVEPGIALQYPGENPASPGGPEMNNPIRFQEDTPLGIIAKFPDQPQVEGVPADRSVEGPPKGSPEWIKEAQSVYQQFSKGLLRTLQHSGERIQMTLDPPELGSILLEITRDRNFVTAHLWTNNPQTKELLDFSQGQLQKTLELDGFKLDRFEVLVQPDLKSFQEERWFGGRQPAWENSREGGRRAAPEGLIPTASETATLRFNQGNQYVDTWV